MKLYDILLIMILAIFPFVITWGFITMDDFQLYRPIVFLILIASLIYFSVKAFQIFVITYSEKTFFKTSVNVEINDVLAGLFWGAVIYQYYELDKGLLLIWLLVGLMIFIIGFTAGAAINEAKGIRLTKNGKWVKWSEIDKMYLNEVFFGFELNENRQYPVLSNKVIKQSFDSLRDGITKVAEIEQISLKRIPDKSSLLLGETAFEEDGEALDDFIAKVKNFVLIESKGLLFSEQNQLIQWSNITNIKTSETIIEIEYNSVNLKTKNLYNDDFNTKDWEILQDVLRIDN